MVGVLVIDMRKRSYPPIWLLFEQGRVQVAAGALFAVGAGGCCDLACRQDPAMSDARPHRRLRLPRLRPRSRPCGFWAVSQKMDADFAMGPGLLCGFRRGVVRCWLRRPEETPALGGVSSRFGLRNRPEVASGIRLHRKLRILACVSVSLALVAGIAITCHQRPSWRIAVVGVSLIDVAKRTQRCVQIQPWRKPTLFSPSHKLCKTCSLA